MSENEKPQKEKEDNDTQKAPQNEEKIATKAPPAATTKEAPNQARQEAARR